MAFRLCIALLAYPSGVATLSRGDVEHVAHLARLGLTDDELARLEGQLNHIVDQYAILAELDTDHIPPTAQTIELENILREDVDAPEPGPRGDPRAARRSARATTSWCRRSWASTATEVSTDLTRLTARQMAAGLRARRFQRGRARHRRISIGSTRTDRALHAWVWWDATLALAPCAAAADERCAAAADKTRCRRCSVSRSRSRTSC